MDKYLGKKVDIKIDRSLGSKHPKYDLVYSINYGFVEGTVQADGEELDAYVIGPKEPLQNFTGTCVAYIERENDPGDLKLIIVSDDLKTITDEEILTTVNFQEKFFKSKVKRS